MHRARLMSCALASVAVVACSVPGQAVPTPEAFTALYVVTNGPHPLYASDGEWLRARSPGQPPGQAEIHTIDVARIARAQNRVSDSDGTWLLKDCIFDVFATTPDQQDATYLWAHGRVVRCAEPIADGVVEPQMGVRPQKLRIYDGRLGFFPMTLLDTYTGSAPAPRH